MARGRPPESARARSRPQLTPVRPPPPPPNPPPSSRSVTTTPPPSPTGVARALHYGEPFLVLRPAVRHRCTVASGDTGGGHGSCALGTATLCAHLLERLSDAELIAAAHVAAGRRSDAPSTLSTTYKEARGVVG